MTFQVEILPIAEAQMEQAYGWYQERNPEFADRWFRGLMNAVATLQEKPLSFPLAIENNIFLRMFVNCFTENLKMYTGYFLQFETQKYIFYTCAIVPKLL